MTGALQTGERTLQKVLAERAQLARELGDVPEARAELDALERAITQSTREHAGLRDLLVERELHNPAAWVRNNFGKPPDGPGARAQWENAVRRAARYRLQHDVTDPGSALGPQPEQRHAQRDWERARNTIARDQRRLGRDVEVELDVDLGIGF